MQFGLISEGLELWVCLSGVSLWRMTSETINQQPSPRLQKLLETTRAIYFWMEFTEDGIFAPLSRNSVWNPKRLCKAAWFPEHLSLSRKHLAKNQPQGKTKNGNIHSFIFKGFCFITDSVFCACHIKYKRNCSVKNHIYTLHVFPRFRWSAYSATMLILVTNTRNQ